MSPTIPFYCDCFELISSLYIDPGNDDVLCVQLTELLTEAEKLFNLMR